MANDVRNESGEDNAGREDEVKSYRGATWILITVGIIVAGAVILLASGFLKSSTDGKPMESPAQIEQKRN